MTIALATPAMAGIEHVLINGIYYNLNVGLKTAEVTYYDISSYGSNSVAYKGDVVIPSMIEYNQISYQVTSIGNSAFSNCGEMTSINLPTTLKTIGGSAFAGCIGLNSIVIPNGVEDIDYMAFDGCHGLTSLSLPEGLKTIGEWAFRNCNLSSINIPEGVTSIDSEAFRYNQNLLTITLPTTLNHLGNKSFDDTKWWKQESMKSLDTGQVYLGNWLYGTINAGAYGSVEIKEGCIGIADAIFSQGLESVTLPSTLQYIGASAFSYSKINSITIPNSVTMIHAGAFAYCKNLSTVNVGDNVYKIGMEAFADTPWLENQPNGLVYAGNVACAYKYNYWEEKTEDIILKDGCLGIADDFFNSAIGAITIPVTVKYISPNYFYNQMPSIIVEEGNKLYDSRNGCNAIIETATNTLILGCKNSVIPNGVTAIGALALGNCELTSISIPNSVQTIGNRAFENSKIKSLVISGSVVNIGNEAFNCCEELESIIVENSNAVYDSRENCNAIIETPTNTLIVGCKKTFIPNSVRKIEYLSCEGMQDLYCYAERVPVATINYPYYTTLYVPVGSVEAYKATSPWSKFK